jgi:hypothetical protein
MPQAYPYIKGINSDTLPTLQPSKTTIGSES